MISAISNGASVQPTRSSVPPQTHSRPKPSSTNSGGDSVRLSKAAQAAMAAAQQSRKTSSQTARQASGGDIQASRLLANEEAAATKSREM